MYISENECKIITFTTITNEPNKKFTGRVRHSKEIFSQNPWCLCSKYNFEHTCSLKYLHKQLKFKRYE